MNLILAEDDFGLGQAAAMALRQHMPEDVIITNSGLMRRTPAIVERFLPYAMLHDYQPDFVDPNTPTVGDRKPKPKTYKKRISRNRIAKQSRKKNR